MNKCETDPCYPVLHCVEGAVPPCKCLPESTPAPETTPEPPATGDSGGGGAGENNPGVGESGGNGEGNQSSTETTTESTTSASTPAPGQGGNSTDLVNNASGNVSTTISPQTNPLTSASNKSDDDSTMSSSTSQVVATTKPSSRKTIDPAAAKVLAGQVSAAVGTATGIIVAASTAGAAAGPAAMVIIGQLQILSQLGKVGDGGGALGALSEGFEWANVDLPVSMFPSGNLPENSAGETSDLNASNSSGVRRWMQSARRSLRRLKKARPDPGETAEMADCKMADLSEEDLEECAGDTCGLINGIPLMDKMIIIFVSIVAVFCARSTIQLIITKCLQKDPWDALQFPNWEGPLLLVHWYAWKDPTPRSSSFLSCSKYKCFELLYCFWEVAW